MKWDWLLDHKMEVNLRVHTTSASCPRAMTLRPPSRIISSVTSNIVDAVHHNVALAMMREGGRSPPQ